MPATLARLACVMLVAFAAAGSASAQAPPAAVADVRDRLSRFVGTVGFTEEAGGVRVTGIIRNLPVGPHGFHIGSIARCQSPTFASAGAIFNPTGKKHGLRNPAGPQLGDLPSLIVPGNGIVTLNLLVAGVTLAGGPTSLIGGDGTALVIHVGDDDQLTEPEGNAGERLACGVILPTDPALASATAQSRAQAVPTITAAQRVIQDAGVAGSPTRQPAVAGQQAPLPQQQQEAQRNVGVQPVSPAASQVPNQRPANDLSTALGSPVVIGGAGVLLLVGGYFLRRRV